MIWVRTIPTIKSTFAYRLYKKAHLLGTAGKSREVLDGEEDCGEIVDDLNRRRESWFQSADQSWKESTKRTCHNDEGSLGVALAAILPVHNVELGVCAEMEVRCAQMQNVTMRRFFLPTPVCPYQLSNPARERLIWICMIWIMASQQLVPRVSKALENSNNTQHTTTLYLVFRWGWYHEGRPQTSSMTSCIQCIAIIFQGCAHSGGASNNQPKSVHSLLFTLCKNEDHHTSCRSIFL